MNTYAAQLDNDKVAIRGIVGTADWATEHLGGVWVDCDHKFGAGWEHIDGGLRPPAPDPSWTWDGTAWQAPDGWEWPDIDDPA
jgi:hypothetical protein